MAANEEVDRPAFKIDPTYEFDAPRFFNFSREETAMEVSAAEQWLEIPFTYSVSPMVAKYKSVSEVSKNGSLEDYIELQKLVARVSSDCMQQNRVDPDPCCVAESACLPTEDVTDGNNQASTYVKVSNEEPCTPVIECCSVKNNVDLPTLDLVPSSEHRETDKGSGLITTKQRVEHHAEMEHVPVDHISSHPSELLLANTSSLVLKSKYEVNKESCAAMDMEMIAYCGGVKGLPITSTSSHPMEQLRYDVQQAVPLVHSTTTEDKSLDVFHKGLNSLSAVIEHPILKKARSSKSFIAKRQRTTDSGLILDEHRTGKRRKLEEGLLQQVNTGSRTSLTLTVPEEFRFFTEERAKIHHGSGNCASAFEIGGSKSPFVSLAERVRKFQARTPERYHSRPSHVDMPSHFKNNEFMLTRPKNPKLRTSYRARPPSVKSFLEQQEEMLANMPKFKALPLNKRILQAATLPLHRRATPDMPTFQEFNLRTTARASTHHIRCTDMNEISSDLQNKEKMESMEVNRNAVERCMAIRGEPHLETALRARPPKVKSTEEMEVEELAKVPKFKARPFNKRIFSSRGDLGVYRTEKRQATRPIEFHFLTDERGHRNSTPPERVATCNHREAREDYFPKLTIPEPFHLSTEERGAFKLGRFQMGLLLKENLERKKSIPRANMLPYTTDFPKIPPKPQPRGITKPEPFHLESVRRHEEEMRHRMEELSRAEKELSEMRNFHAQPILCNGPFFAPERCRKPLTEIQPFVFRAEARAIERSEFDRKVAEKKAQYEQMKEELESARRLEEERSLKKLRKELLFHAKPVPQFGTPFVPLRSMKELTQPISPRFHAATYDDQRHRHTSSMPLYHMR